MITLRKLQSLPRNTRLRKEALILQEIESDLQKDTTSYVDPRQPQAIYLKGLCELVCGELEQDFNYPHEEASLLRYCNDLRHRLLRVLGQEPADWDFTVSPDREGERKVRPVSLYLDNIRSPFNLGSIFRTAEAMGIKEVLLSPDCVSPDHDRARRSSMGALDILPWRWAEYSDLQGPLVAMETGGTPLSQFQFPEEATLLVGSEELGLSPELLERADQSLGRVTIPLMGSKGSLNVGVALGIVLSWWGEF